MNPFLLVLLLLPVLAFGQNETVPGVLILKAHPEHRTELLREGVESASFAGLEVLGSRLMFPNAEAPEGRTDRHGNPFVDLTRTFRLDVAKHTDLADAVRNLMSTGKFEWVETTTFSDNFSTPNDPLIGSQSHLTLIDAFGAWAVTTGDTNVVIGVTDTSFDLSHPDLQDNHKKNYDDPVNGIDDDGDGYTDNFVGWDIFDGDNELSVYNEIHGTAVLAVAAASTDNGAGIAGVGYKSMYLPVKIGNNASNSSIVTSDGYEAITYCADRDCKVINCSWGTTLFTQLGQDVVDYATINKDALVVAAAGNQAVEEFRYPASFHKAFSVTGVHNNDVFNNGSNPTFTYSDSVDVCAQGFGVYTTAMFNGTPVYQATGGTSYAAPQVSGAVALLRGRFPCLSALEAAEMLLEYAVDIETVGSNSDYTGKIGKRLDIGAALTPEADPCEPVGIEDEGTHALFLLYPNPTTDAFTLRTTKGGKWIVEVTDMQGRRVMQQAFTGRTFTVSGLSPGLYNVVLDNSENRSAQRVVVTGL